MTYTLSGWPAIPSSTRANLKTFTIPGTITIKNPKGRRLTVRSDVGPYLVAFASEFNKLIMPLNKNTGAYNYREARNGNGKLSDHAAGVAMDLNWDILKQADRESLTTEQYTKLVKLVEAYPRLGWGGYYGGGIKGRSPMYDPMHFFLADNDYKFYMNQMKQKGISPSGKISKPSI